MLKQLKFLLVVAAASMAFIFPSLAQNVATPASADQTVEQAEEEVPCNELVLGRDRIPDRCITRTGGSRYVSEDGGDIVCRNIRVVGSRIPQRVCATGAERDAAEEEVLEMFMQTTQDSNTSPYN